MPLGCFSLFYWYADCKHITPHHNRKIITAVVFDCVRYGGPDGRLSEHPPTASESASSAASSTISAVISLLSPL